MGPESLRGGCRFRPQAFPLSLNLSVQAIHLTASHEHIRALELHLHEFFAVSRLEFFRDGPLIVQRPFAGVGVTEVHLEGAKASFHRVVTTKVTTREGL
ncbi:hypothetical protein D3C72_2215150 [compost metagenome]